MCGQGDSPEVVLDLDGKVAVSGGSRGIGKAMARRLAEEGADVVCVRPGARHIQGAAIAVDGGGTKGVY